MTHKTPWAEQFKISSSDLEKWQSEAGPSEHFLRWCLLNGKINETQYLEWACRFYELPMVEPSFFSRPPDSDFWETVHKDGPWQPAFFPLHKWDGTLLIACLEPRTQDLKVSKPHRFVLASARALNLLWTALNHNLDITARIEDKKPKPAPSTAISSAPPPLPSAIDEAPTFDFETADRSPAMNADFGVASAPDTPVAMDMPEGLKPLPDFPDVPTDISPAAETSPAADVDAPTGLNLENNDFDFNFDFSASRDENGPRSSSRSVMPEPQSEPEPSLAEESETDELEEPTQPSPFSDPSLGSGANFGPGESHEISVVHKQMDQHLPQPLDLPTSFDTNNASKANQGKPATDISQATTFEGVADAAFLRMQEQFPKSMMLLFQSGALRPWRWSAGFNRNETQPPSAIQLDSPSMFRIAYSTSLPYHGYVAPNPINNAFLAEWNDGHTPAHVTIMPIMIQNQIAGMLLGFSDNKKIDLRQSLSNMEDITSQVTEAFRRTRARRAA